MTEHVLHGVGSSTPSFRALVAESSNSVRNPFYGYFLDAATTRSMTGVRYGGECFAWRRGFHSVIPRASRAIQQLRA